MKEPKRVDSHLLDSIGAQFVDEPTIYPDVDISEVTREFPPVRNLPSKIHRGRNSVDDKNITQKDIHIPTIVPSSIDWITHDYGLFAKATEPP